MGRARAEWCYRISTCSPWACVRLLGFTAIYTPNATTHAHTQRNAVSPRSVRQPQLPTCRLASPMHAQDRPHLAHVAQQSAPCSLYYEGFKSAPPSYRVLCTLDHDPGTMPPPRTTQRRARTTACLLPRRLSWPPPPLRICRHPSLPRGWPAVPGQARPGHSRDWTRQGQGPGPGYVLAVSNDGGLSESLIANQSVPPA